MDNAAGKWLDKIILPVQVKRSNIDLLREELLFFNNWELINNWLPRSYWILISQKKPKDISWGQQQADALKFHTHIRKLISLQVTEISLTPV